MVICINLIFQHIENKFRGDSMKIGIFGGSFNPVHKMHKNISLELIEHGYLDKVIYVPTGDSYNKKGLISFEDRVNMLKLMIQKYNNLSLSEIGNNKDYGYTYQTLDYFKKKKQKADIYFICGTDNLLDFDTWKEYEYILDNYKLLVIIRNNDDVYGILDNYGKYKDNIIITDIEARVVSSTNIRENLKKNIRDENIEKEVYDYIMTKKLYK